ncbi:uncharacterized protein LOC131659532 [Vicia villosa]|uniref:uncharacterized protein LOC131659532 n=1 Tax=Vicia villosa TaxID=3911 RepID=UPI00273B0214|nr:uncharacterized protein LOC131659532 [Vicia villosa]
MTPAATVAAIAPNCELYGVQGHIVFDFQLLDGIPPDQMNYAQGNPYSNTYNPGWKNHPNFSYKNNNVLYAPQAPLGFQKPNQAAPQAAPQAPYKSNLEIMMEIFVATQTQQNKEFMNQNVHTSELVKELATKAKSNDESNKATEPETGARDEADKEKPYVPPPPYKPPIPFPQRLAKSKTEGQFKKFVELLKQLNITIPFTEAIIQIPSYANFLKEILSNKKKLEDNETVMLTAKCSAIIQNNMPPKLKDPGSFAILCVIGKFIIDKALYDLGVSVSLMPLSICEKLQSGELIPTRMSLQLANRSVKYPVGMLENIPVRICQFYIPTDFIIMDIHEDSNIPIILGRPFLATAGAIIDVKRGKLTFEVGKEKIEFILSQFLKAPSIVDTCCFVDIIDECVKEIKSEPLEETKILRIPIPPILEDDN